jgi:excisionase family DNA binding protein
MTRVIPMPVEQGSYNEKELEALIHGLEKVILARNEVMRVDQAAAFINISRAQVDRMCRDGQLPFHRLEGLGGKLFLRTELIDFIKKH